MYKIKICYNTGDSFKQEDNLRTVLPYEFKKIETAKENLKRIKEHYLWSMKKSGFDYRTNFKELEAFGKKQRWYCKKYPEVCIMLIDDNNKEFQASSGTWCGYFESLNWAKIIEVPGKDDDILFEVEGNYYSIDDE